MNRLARLVQRTRPATLAERVQRRLHEPVIAAVVLTLTRGRVADAVTLGPRGQVVLALSEQRVWVLDHAWPSTIGGVVAHFERSGTLLHTRRQPLARRHRIELSCPEQGGFLVGRVPLSEAADLLIGHLTADEFAQR